MRRWRLTQTGSHLEEWAALLDTDISVRQFDEDEREPDCPDTRDDCL